jgi:integrase
MLAAGSSAFHLCWFNYWQNTKCTVARARRGEAGLAQGDWVFTSPTGRPLVPNSDYHRWKALLKAARVRDARCMTLVITAATVLLILGVPERTVMGIMGWSSTSMASRYQHVTDPIRRDVAARVGGLIWVTEQPDSEPTETKTETRAHRGEGT